MTDWSASHIRIGQLHNKLTTLLNDKKHSEAFSILLEMQGEVLKLQQFVLYGIEVPRTKYDSIAEFEALLESARNDKEFIKELHAELMNVKLPGDDSAMQRHS